MLILLYGIYLPRFKGSECLVFFKSVVLALSTHRPLWTGEAKIGAIVFKACIFLFKLITMLMLRTEKNEQQHFT